MPQIRITPPAIVVDVDADFPDQILIAHSPKQSHMGPEIVDGVPIEGPDVEIVDSPRAANMRISFGDGSIIGYCDILSTGTGAQRSALVAALRPFIVKAKINGSIADV